MFTSIDKALIALIVPMIMAGLSQLGITPEMTVGEAVPFLISTLIVAGMVWLVPNKR